MIKQLIPIVFALVLIVLSPLSVEAAEPCDGNEDCTSPDVCIGGACVPPVEDPDAYVTEAMTRWSSYVWAVQFPSFFEPLAEDCCFDYTGDGNPDNAFGNVLVAMTSAGSGFEPVLLMDSSLENGEMVKVFDWRELAADLATGDVQLSIFDGLWTDSTAHADRILGLGHTAFHRSSFGPYGAFDQLNAGIVTSGFVEVAGDHITLDLPWRWPTSGLVPLQLHEPRLEAPVTYGETRQDACLGLCSVDEDRGAGHAPQIVGGARLGGVIRAEEILTRMDAFYRECACAAPAGGTLSIEWQENTVSQTFEVWCPTTPLAPGDFGYNCLDGDPCGEMQDVCAFVPVIGITVDVDLDGTDIYESWSIGLRLGFAGTFLDPFPELFADGFESGDTGAWANGTIAFVTSPPYEDGDQISWVGRVFCMSGNCPWYPPDQLHDGIDFVPTPVLDGFLSGCDGTVDAVDLFLNPGNGFYQVNVLISCSADPTGGLVYAFEPMSSDPLIGTQQMDQIAVTVGDSVFAGDVIGDLVVTDPASHLHWGVTSGFTQVCPEPRLQPPVAADLLALIQRDHPAWNICH